MYVECLGGVRHDLSVRNLCGMSRRNDLSVWSCMSMWNEDNIYVECLGGARIYVECLGGARYDLSMWSSMSMGNDVNVK